MKNYGASYVFPTSKDVQTNNVYDKNNKMIDFIFFKKVTEATHLFRTHNLIR